MRQWAWLTLAQADVPSGDAWLGERERAVLAGLRVPKRRDDWRLGRHTAKTAVAAWLGLEPAQVEILAAADGAPEAQLANEPAPVALSLSHRAGRSMALVGPPDAELGCDLELVEPRSDVFVGDWFAADEQALVRAAGERRDLVANLLWCGKEAAAKARREGLRLDVRDARVAFGEGAGDWQPLAVHWGDGAGEVRGWWRSADGFVMAVIGPAGAPPPLATGPRATATPPAPEPR